MTFIRYIDRTIGLGRQVVIETANQIVEEHARQGIVLTLRAIYYQFVSRFAEILDPAAVAEGRTVNTQQNYKRLGDVLNIGRLAGLMSWEAMEDITRNEITTPAWAGPEDFLNDAADWFAADLWANQPCRPLVWIEKDAQLGTFRQVCNRNRVNLLSCRGNVSQSEMWAAAQRLITILGEGQIPVMLYAGDHDPNGLDMTRDVRERLELFCGEPIEVRRILLNMDQIKRFNPPPNPVKNTDSRAAGYRRAMQEAGFDPDECFEMDAMPAREMVRIVQAEIDSLRDPDLWAAALAREGRLTDAVKDCIARGLDDYRGEGYGEDE
jgi:hypothetical protein